MSIEKVENEWLTELECSQLLKIAPATLKFWRWQSFNKIKGKSGPPFHRLGARLIRYRRVEVESWAGSTDEVR